MPPPPYTCPVLAFTTKTNKVDLVDAAHINAVQSEIVAINYRLLNTIDSDGSILSGDAFRSPYLTSQLFYRTDLGVVYVFSGTAWVPQSGVTSYTVGDVLTWGPSAIGGSESGTSYVKIFEMTLPRAGALRIKFVMALTNPGGGGTAEAKIYRNGVAVGTERSVAGTPTEYSEDISGWTAGDLLQIYGKTTGATGSCTVFGVCLFEAVPPKEYPTVNLGLAYGVFGQNAKIYYINSADLLSNGYGEPGDLLVKAYGTQALTFKKSDDTWN